ncbi:ubiquitin-protein ligase [Lithospermum erythrorhizon]|uniref:E2 ubiquitin-conjugating enzyme n=1 Tax=Lithospermum erythrorhizon TaxID=34254 RepID=A0AAV3RW93_LITER
MGPSKLFFSSIRLCKLCKPSNELGKFQENLFSDRSIKVKASRLPILDGKEPLKLFEEMDSTKRSHSLGLWLLVGSTASFILADMATNENLPPNVIKQLARELKNLDETPPEGIKVGVNDDNFSNIHADIEGPAGTPYENGVFRMKLLLSHDFPLSPPKGYFLTKIFHPNIANNGEICVNALKRDWNPNLGLRHVLMVIRCLLIEPFPESSLNEQAGKMLLDNYEEYARYAR